MDLTYFNPNSQKEADFLLGFVARQRILEFLLHQIKLVPANGPARQQLIVAPRGFGKTSLLRRIAIEVRDDEELKKKFIALRFREEQHNVISLDVFWRNCLQSLTEAREDEGATAKEIDSLDAAWAKHTPRQALSQEEQDGDPAWQTFRTHCEYLQRRPLLLIDNFDMLLDGLTQSHQWSLRNRLQNDDGPVLIAAASRYPASTHNQNAAFYEFFRISPLEKLDDQEVFICLRNIAAHRGTAGKAVLSLLDKDPGRVVALNILAGGNPRTLSVLYGVLESHMSADVLSQLNAMLDTFTGWYQVRTEELPTQSRAIFDALALNWDPMTAAALGLATGLDTSAVSSQLTRLEKSGYVESVALNKRGKGRNGYQVSERFFNIWYLMRNGPRRARQSILFLTKFLQSCFSSSELKSHAAFVLKNGQSDPTYTLALASSFRRGRLREQLLEQAHLKSTDCGQEAEYESIISELRNEEQKRSVVQAKSENSTKLISDYNNIVDRFGMAKEPSSRDKVANALLRKGHRFAFLGESEQAIEIYDDIVARFGTATEPSLRKKVAKALLNKGYRLGILGRSEQALDVYNDVIARFATNADIALDEEVAKATFNKGVRLGILGRTEQAISAYNDVVHRFETSTNTTVREQVAKAIFNKGIRLSALNQSEEAIKAYDDLVFRFDDAKEHALQQYIAIAILHKGNRLGILGQSEKAIHVYDDLITRFNMVADPAVQVHVASALINKGFRLGVLGLSDKALKVYDEVVTRFGQDTSIDFETRVAKALLNKSSRLRVLNLFDQAIVVYDEIIERFSGKHDTSLNETVAKAFLLKGISLSRISKFDEEIIAYDNLFAHFSTSTVLGVRESVAAAMLNKGLRLGILGKPEEAINVYDGFINLFGAATEIHLRELLGKVLLNKALKLGEISKTEEELETYEEIVARFIEATEVNLRESVARALLAKAARIGELNLPEKEIAIYDEIIKMFGSADESLLHNRVATALILKGNRLSALGRTDQAISVYDEIISKFSTTNESTLRKSVAGSFAEKGDLLRRSNNFDSSKSTYEEAIRWDPTVSIFYVCLGNLLFDSMGELEKAIKTFEDGLKLNDIRGDHSLLEANLAYAITIHNGDYLTAQKHAQNALKNGSLISEAGQWLLKALPIWNENINQSWPQVFENIGKALTSEDPELWSNYGDDIQRLLHIIIKNGQGDNFTQWLVVESFDKRFAPLYHAFVAALNGEDHLLQINPETRQPAKVIYSGIEHMLKLFPYRNTK